MGKQIQDVQIWTNGNSITGNYIEAIIVNDNLNDYAQFLWEISKVTGSGLDQVKEVIERGNTTISGNDYIIWGETTDINLAAYQYICTQLNLTLIP